MTANGDGISAADHAPPVWLRILLGIILIVGGLFILWDVELATVVSTFLIGFTAIGVGAFEVVHAFWTKGWGGFFWHLLLGALYMAFGWAVTHQPLTGTLILTAVLGSVFLASGVVRIVIAFRNWRAVGAAMLTSGIFGVIAGGIIILGWPVSSLWGLGVLLGVDLISNGVAWLMFGLSPPMRSA